MSILAAILASPLLAPVLTFSGIALTQLALLIKAGNDNKVLKQKLNAEQKLVSQKYSLDEFVVIRDSLAGEVRRLGDKCDKLEASLKVATDEATKCEARYFELASQYGELMKYCEHLGKEVKSLQGRPK